MTRSNIDINEIICKLLHGLRDKGYSIGTDAYIRTTQVFYWFLSEKKNSSMESFAIYLAPVICKSNDEQTNFKKIFNEKFLNEFIEFGKNYKAEVEKENGRIKKEKDQRNKKIICVVSIVALVTCSVLLVRYLNRPYTPVVNYKGILPQPFFVNKNNSVDLSHAAVFSDPKDSSDFNAEYKFYRSGKVKKGITVSHNFEHYGKDTVSVRLFSEKYKMDTTILYPEIYVGPENLLSVSAGKEFIEPNEENEYTTNSDSSLNVGSYWMVDSNKLDNKKSLHNKLKYSFKEQGEHLISINYNTEKDSFLQKFPKEYLSASYIQKVVPPGMQLTASHSLPPLVTKNAVSKIWLAALLALLLFLIYWIFRIIRRRKKIQSPKEAEDDFKGSNPPYDLFFISKEQNISGNYSLLRLSNDLKKRVQSNSSSLDIQETIKQTIFNRGFISPQFSQKQVNREYLFLIDHVYANSQQVKLFSYLARFLIQHQVKLDFYFYHQTPDKFYKDVDGPSIKLDDLKDQYYNAALIIFSDGSNFIEYRTPVVKNKIINGFNYWQNRVLITPTPVNDWARDEKILSTFFGILPADMEGLLELIRAIDAGNSDNEFLQAKFNSYKTKYVDFDNIDALREYLDDEELFQWLCALAIHPKIYWDLILEIGKNILKDPSLRINYETLLKFSRIQWITEGSFPPPTRLALLKELKKENEIKARETMLRMLDEIPTGENLFSYEEKQLSRYTNSFVLSATGIEKYKSDKKIQANEQKFISLYRNKKLFDVPFKIYIEKKQTENGSWDTPVVTSSADNGIEQYIKAQDDEKLREERNNRLKRNKAIARFIAGAAAIILFIGYLFFYKDTIANSKANQYLHLVDTSIVPDDALQVNLFITECLNKLLLSSKDSTAQFEASSEGAVLFSNKIKYENISLFPIRVEGLKYDSSKTITYSLIVKGQPYNAQAPFTSGVCNIRLDGACESDKAKNDTAITVNYYPGYKEDSLPIIKEIKNIGYPVNVFSSTNKKQLNANSIAFAPDIDTATMYAFANNLITAGFHLKHLQYASKTESHYINIVNDNYYNDKPDITVDSLKCLLIYDCNKTTPVIKQIPVQIFYNDKIFSIKAKDLKECINAVSLYNNHKAQTKYASGFSNDQLLFYGDSASYYIKLLHACLGKYFPEKTFIDKRSFTPLKSNALIEIYVYNATKVISIEISDNSLTNNGSQLQKDLFKQGYTIASFEKGNRDYKSVVEYYNPKMASAALQVKDLCIQYFPGLSIETKYIKNQEQHDVSDIVVWVRKEDMISTPKAPRSYIRGGKFPPNVSANDKFSVSFNVVIENNISNQVNQNDAGNDFITGQTCISGEKQCNTFRIADGNTIRSVTTEIDIRNLQPGRHELRVKIDKLKIDTSLGFFNLGNGDLPVKTNLCDTMHSYIGLGNGNVLFRGNTYLNKAPKNSDIFMMLTERNNNFGKFTISTSKCGEKDLTLYVNKPQTIQLCDGRRITFTLLDWEDKTSKLPDHEAIFDAIICKPNENEKQKIKVSTKKL